MARIKGRNTAPELIVRRVLAEQGFHYRLHAKSLPGHPDICFRKLRKVIFVHGCFWHRHTCTRGRSNPATNVDFWAKKFRKNVARDREALHSLKALGWKCLVVWECESKDRIRLTARLKRFLSRSEVASKNKT
jgi:DNA mismatch endonuclease, patch repair protein